MRHEAGFFVTKVNENLGARLEAKFHPAFWLFDVRGKRAGRFLENDFHYDCVRLENVC